VGWRGRAEQSATRAARVGVDTVTIVRALHPLRTRTAGQHFLLAKVSWWLLHGARQNATARVPDLKIQGSPTMVICMRAEF